MCQNYLSERAAQDPAFKFMPVILGSENPQCSASDVHAKVQSLVARFQLYSSLLGGISSAIVTPHLGALSDRVGRKKIIIFATFGTFCAEVITIVVGTHPLEFSVYWLLLGSLLDGLCGSFTTGMALSFAYASDCTPPDRRNVAFGYFHGTLFTGIALGPILAGYLIKWAGTIMIAFYVGIGCHIYYILFLTLFVPESLSKERQLHAREKYRKEMQTAKDESWLTRLRNYNLFKPLWILWPKGKGSSPLLRKNLFLLAGIDTIMFGVAMGTVQIILIYAEFMFNWKPFESTLFLSIVNTFRVTTLVIILPLLTRFVRGPARLALGGHHGADMLDINIIRVAILFDLLGYIGYVTSRSGQFLILSGVIASVGVLVPQRCNQL